MAQEAKNAYQATRMGERWEHVQVSNKRILEAAEEGDKEVASRLLEQGANVEAADEIGWTPLHHAAWHGHLELASLLLEQGANVETANYNGWTPLHHAAWNGHLEVASLSLEQGASIEAADNVGETPLHFAARNGHLEVASLLLEQGAAIEGANEIGWTPLHHAARYGQLDVASLLLEQGANIEAATKDGGTPLYVAAWEDQKTMLSLLLERGAKVTTFVYNEGDARKPRNMTTPLHYIVSSGSDEKLTAVLHELNSKSLSDVDVLRSVYSDVLAVLLARDGQGRAVVDLLYARLSKSDCPEVSSMAGVFGQPAVKELLERTPFPFARVYLCGPGGAGKTLLRCQLQGDIAGARDLESKPVLETRTRSVHISSANLQGVRSSLNQEGLGGLLRSVLAYVRDFISKDLPGSGLHAQIFDFGGQQEFEVTYVRLLKEALSVFLLTIPVCPAGIKYRDDDGGEHYVLEPTTPETTKRDLKHWLSLLSTVAHPIANQVVVAVNVFEGVDARSVKRHVAAVQTVLREYAAWTNTGTEAKGAPPRAVDSIDVELGEREGTQTRLNLVEQGFVVLNCKSSTEWRESPHENGSLFDSMRLAWNNLQSLEERHGLELSMPKLCSDLLARVPEFRESRPPIDTARNAREAMRGTMRGVFEDLSDKAIDALLGYLEKCGEVLLKYPRVQRRFDEQREITSRVEDVVIWDPNWFLSSVVGEFFQPLAWRRDAFLDVRMKPENVRDVLRFPVENAMPDVDDEEMNRILSTLMVLMKDMQLCAYVRTRTNAEYWFPLFLNSPDLRVCLSSHEEHGKELPIEKGVVQDHLPAKDILYAQFEDLEEHAWSNADCRLRGRLLSIRDLRPDEGSGDDAGAGNLGWRIVLPGSFERFMARVLEAFPSETEDHVKLFMTPNLIQLTWRSSSEAKKCAHVQCQMVHEDGIKVAWVAWVWASDDEAAAHLLKDDTSAEKDAARKDVARKDVTLQVIEQLCGWMQEASMDDRVMVSWRKYPLENTAFLHDGGEVFHAGRKYLATGERQFPSSTGEVMGGERTGDASKMIVGVPMLKKVLVEAFHESGLVANVECLGTEMENLKAPVEETRQRTTAIETSVVATRKRLEENFQNMEKSFENVIKRVLHGQGDLSETLRKLEQLVTTLLREERLQEGKLKEVLDDLRKLDVGQYSQILQRLDEAVRTLEGSASSSSTEDMLKKVIMDEMGKLRTDLQSTIDSINRCLQEQERVLRVLRVHSMQRFHGDCAVPFTALVFPKDVARALRCHFERQPLRMWRMAKWALSDFTRWLTDDVYLYFWCPKTGLLAKTNNGKGYKIKVLKNAALPFKVLKVLVGLSLMVIGALTGTSLILSSLMSLVDVDVSNGQFDNLVTHLLEDMQKLELIDGSLAALQPPDARKGVPDELKPTDVPDESKTTDAPLDRRLRVDDTGRVCVNIKHDEMIGIGGTLYAQLVSILKEEGMLVDSGSYSLLFDSGLELTEGMDGYFMWVHEEAVEDYKRQGRACLLQEVQTKLGLPQPLARSPGRLQNS